MAKYDLPASINFILRKTGQEKIFYVGHSQGTTMAFIAFSTMPQLAQKIKMFFGLAPSVNTVYSISPISAVITHMPESLVKVIFGTKQCAAQSKTFKWFATNLCNRFLLDHVCASFFFLGMGFNAKNMNLTRINVYLSHCPAGTSVQNVLHWSQVAPKSSGVGSANLLR
uniref:AB hydrolase-1 domain-containing protein n=1 Tax=Podarcis muralis TaxID=64176 RepID=A0A670HL19_PODMU